MKKGCLLLLLLLFAWAGFSQETGNERFVPFVSKLKAKADESKILITWRNPKSFQGTLLVYRHSTEIDQDNLSDAVRIASLAADRESYEDSPPDYQPYYYAVLIEDSAGTIQKLFIPFRNITSRGVRVSVLPPVEEEAARITEIQAVVSDDSVQVDFQTSNSGRDLLLFRSNSPMTTAEDLIEAFAPLQLEAGVTHFVDFPIPGVESFYAVVDTEMFKLGKQVLIPDENTTAEAVFIPLEVPRVALPAAPVAQQLSGEAEEGEREAGAGQTAPGAVSAPAASMQAGQMAGQGAAQSALTATPLPYLQPTEDSRSSFALPPRSTDLDPRTEAAISRLLSSAPPLQASQRAVVILPEDKDEPNAGESRGLYKILQDFLLPGDYTEAESKLQGSLNIRRSPYTEAKVHFYLAQAYYFQELYEEALLEFVLAQDQLYAPVQPWLESCFRNLWKTR
jgi:hypothetical protein